MALNWKQLALEEPVDAVDLWIRVYWYQGTPVEAQYNSTNQEFTTNLLGIVFPAWAVARWAYANETLDNLQIFELESTGNGEGVATLKLEVSENIYILIGGNGRFYNDAGGITNPTTQRLVESGAMRTFYLKQPTGTVNLIFGNADKVTKFGDSSNNGWNSGTNGPNLSGTLELLSGLTDLYVTGSNTLTGDVAGLPSGLTYLYVAGSNTLTGDVAGLPSGLTYSFVAGSNTLTGDVAGLPLGLIDLYVAGLNTLTGDVAGLPSGLTYLLVTGSNTLTGDVAGLPSGLTYLIIYGLNTLTGDVSGLPAGLTYLNISGSNTLTGDVSGLPAGLIYLLIYGLNTLSDYTTKTWATKPSMFDLQGNASLSSAEIDQLLIDFDADLAWSAGDAITLLGNCQARTSASDSAVANMISEGATITTN